MTDKRQKNKMTLTRPIPIFDFPENIIAGVDGIVQRQSKQLLSEHLQGYSSTDWSGQFIEICDKFLRGYLVPIEKTNSFLRFRSELERFTLWLFLEAKLNPMELQQSHTREYINFLRSPNPSWLSPYNSMRVKVVEGQPEINPNWRPLWARKAKASSKSKINSIERKMVDKNALDNYRPKDSTIQSSLRLLRTFYKFLIAEQLKELIKTKAGEPSQGLISNDATFENLFIEANNTFAIEIQRNKSGTLHQCETLCREHTLSETQWNYVLDTAEILAEENPRKYTRALFIIVLTNATLIRVSEMCASNKYTPKMNDFVYSKSNNVWTLKVRAAHNSQREVVVPDSVIPYLIQYRRQRWLRDLPDPLETAPLLSKLRPKSISPDDSYTWIEKSITFWTAVKDVQRVLDETIRRLNIKNKKQDLISDIDSIANASSKWLRNTGASSAIKDGNNLLHVSKGLGHKDVRTTQIGYVSNNPDSHFNSNKKKPI